MVDRFFVFFREVFTVGFVVEVFEPEQIALLVFPTHYLFHFMRAERMPFADATAVFIRFLQLFHEQVRNRHAGKNIVRFAALVAIVRFQIQEAVHDVLMEDI